ncbi:MAG: hypothetical protein OXT70_01055 [Chloroflexota bacterium]|nr:hypothetical protein [Chloroflexota bacterium]
MTTATDTDKPKTPEEWAAQGRADAEKWRECPLAEVAAHARQFLGKCHPWQCFSDFGSAYMPAVLDILHERLEALQPLLDVLAERPESDDA